ncbi:MAG TPA: tRNA (N(6)-L-threonylcarbamoyladenosine(37)-C(2))-methylthiotransferase MtaB [Bacteroidales bacterium]|nr:tRNA (N(6)-L-threonylcarbamoyladenosine(37)-C(2))-methylthiotransferase MtaB [Bacteroidales bacterium]HRX95952.1 tRNA (N(6)-L-threonylcarbamoyladenosine(37)-C(2))-methylthiotransferase MtaB [Bacteroidales bacterium]
MNKKIAFKTLGCRLNLYETDSVMSEFARAGYEIVDFNEQADAYVINTCTVTNMGDHKSRQTISQAGRRNEEAVLVVTGCMVNNHKDLLDQNDRITYVIENDRKGSIFHLLDGHFQGEIIHPDELLRDRFAFGSAETSFHSRSLIKIQDGCDNFCTFCIVPHVRGRAESRSFEDIEKNIKEVLSYGYKEIILTGVNIGRYERDGLNFEGLVEKILEIPGDFRVRISSIEPEGFGEKLFKLFHHPKLTPHLHMCLQSGSEKVLLKMRRQYTVDEFEKMVGKIKDEIPDFNFTTDIIVGFPGETEEDFQETCDAVDRIGFSHIHTFKYSVRKGTRAERLPDHLPEKVKNERSAIIRELAEKHKRNYRLGFIGKTQTVYVEKIDARGFAHGYGEHYIPIRFKASKTTQLKDFHKVEITGIENGIDPKLIGAFVQ